MVAGGKRSAPGELDSMSQLHDLLVKQQGWTVLTAVGLMLFSLLHDPGSTTILTIWKETRSRRWTLIGALLPLGLYRSPQKGKRAAGFMPAIRRDKPGGSSLSLFRGPI